MVAASFSFDCMSRPIIGMALKTRWVVVALAVLIFSRSPPYLLLIIECQSARKTMKWKPDWIKSWTLEAQTSPWPMCIIPCRVRPLSGALEPPIGPRILLLFQKLLQLRPLDYLDSSSHSKLKTLL